MSDYSDIMIERKFDYNEQTITYHYTWHKGNKYPNIARISYDFLLDDHNIFKYGDYLSVGVFDCVIVENPEPMPYDDPDTIYVKRVHELINDAND